MVEQTATATALGQASGTASRHSAQNVHYKMKYNSATGKWEQEQIMTPLVQSVYPGIRTKEGKTKDISTGLVSQPEIRAELLTTPTPEPEVTPLPIVTDGTPTTGVGGYQQVQEQYKEPTVTRQETGGIRYEEGQTRGVSESQLDRMKYNVMPGGLNFRSAAQNTSLSQSHGLIDDLVNPKIKTEEEIKAQKKKIGALGSMGAVIGALGTVVQPHSQKLQITKMIESGVLQVRRGEGYDSVLLSNEEAIKALTQDENGRTKILQGKDLINSGLKVTQAKHLSKDYAQSAAFMNFQEDKASNFSTSTGIKLTTLNPVMGSSGTTLFGIFKDAQGASATNGEQVLVVEASGGGGYRSDGKFVGMNSQIYAFGTAAQAQESANGGLLPESVLERMTNEDGSLKNLYDPNAEDNHGGIYNLDSSMIEYKNGKAYYIGDKVLANRDLVDNTGKIKTNVADKDSDDYKTFVDERWEKPVTPTREEVEAPIREKYDTTGRGGTGEGREEQQKEKFEKEEAKPKEERKKGCFHPEQLIENKFMKEFEPGDFINGKEIHGMIKLKLNEDMYSINNVRVTGSHGMKYKDKWIFVADHPDSIIIKDKPKFVYIPIVETGTFTINNEEFADYDYHDMVLLGDEEWKKRRGFQKAA